MGKNVEIILRRRVADLGDVGDVVDVKAGYARNYLLPQGLAYPATEENRHRIEQEREKALAEEQRARERAERLAERLQGVSITFSMRAAEEGKLYGSVSPRDIASKLEEEGYEVEPRHTQLVEPIKALGVYSVPLRLHPDVETSVKVWVIKEEE